MMKIPRILIIAGSDSGGGAGIQADIKTVTMLGGHAMTAITAITAQNTLGVTAIRYVDEEMVAAQVAAVADDIGIDAIKIGMLGTESLVRFVAAILVAEPQIAARSAAGAARRKLPPGLGRIPIVLDPVMVATSGSSLIEPHALAALRNRLLPLATLVTPNVPELAALTGRPVADAEDARLAALGLAAERAVAVLAKGGHLPGGQVIDQLVLPDGSVTCWEAPRIESRDTHGTGCTLASAIAVGLAEGKSLADSVTRARAFVRAALAAAPGLGAGSGPVGHTLGMVPFDSSTEIS